MSFRPAQNQIQAMLQGWPIVVLHQTAPINWQAALPPRQPPRAILIAVPDFSPCYLPKSTSGSIFNCFHTTTVTDLYSSPTQKHCNELTPVGLYYGRPSHCHTSHFSFDQPSGSMCQSHQRLAQLGGKV